MSGVIYQITCNPTNMKYVGQATKFKYKHGKPYNYGASGRWSDHLANSKTRNTPLCQAIKTYGKGAFTIKVLEEGQLETLDEREAHWISELNTIHPHGYNVAAHSRNRHRDSSNLHIFYQDKVQSAIISPIRAKGELRLAYVYLTMKDGTQERVAFGQTRNRTYEETLEEVHDFLRNLNCPYTTSTDYSDKLSERYASKLKEFENKVITSVRITSNSKLIAVYIGTSEMTLNKEHRCICFGGKTRTLEESYEIAKQFVAELHVSDEIIHDSIKSRQQATA